MFNGKMKAVTFSYDDGVTQDMRLIELLGKYNLKATFNINSELLGKEGSLERGGKTVSHNKNKAEDVRAIYSGHEIAAHTLTHPLLTRLDESDIIRQIEQDRENLSELAGYEVVGMAYPGGKPNFDGRVAEIVRTKTKIKYARTTLETHNFDLQSDLFVFRPSVCHIMEPDALFELGEQFITLKPDTPKLFYIWGHSYEFDIDDTWSLFEDFCRLISGKDDIFYGTNKEVLL